MIREIVASAAAVIIEDLRGPTDPVKPGEVVIGSMPNDLRGLWSVMEHASAKHKSLCVRQLGSFSQDAFAKLSKHEQQEIKRLHDLALLEYKTATMMLALSIREVFIAHMKSTLELRDNWQIVKTSKPTKVPADMVVSIELSAPHSEHSCQEEYTQPPQ